MIEEGLKGVEFHCDKHGRSGSSHERWPTSSWTSDGNSPGAWGAGANPDIGTKSQPRTIAKRSREVLKGADMVFVTAGEGRRDRHRRRAGSWPTWRDRWARSRSAWSPGRSDSRGKRRAAQADAGHREAPRRGGHSHRDTERQAAVHLRPARQRPGRVPRAADQVLLSGVQGITDLITTPGADQPGLRGTSSRSCRARAPRSWESARPAADDRSVAAAEMAISSPPARGEHRRGPWRACCRFRAASDLGLFRDQRGGAARLQFRCAGRQHHFRRGHRRWPSATRSGLLSSAAGFDESQVGRAGRVRSASANVKFRRAIGPFGRIHGE